MKPCEFNRISSPFGYRTHPITGKRQYHNGVDLAAPQGTPVYATINGVAKLSSTAAGGLQVVIVNGDSHVRVGYAHLLRQCVKNNSIVNVGDKIGEVGTTGHSTGPHLHYTMALLKDNNAIDRYVDPKSYVV